MLKKKEAKPLESEISLFLEVFVVQFSNQQSTQFQLSFQQVKVKVCSLTFHSHVYEDSDRKLGRLDKLVGLRLKSFDIIIN